MVARTLSAIASASLLVVTACVSQSASYAPPSESAKLEEFSRVVPIPYDDAWKALIEYIGGTFFGIDHFEKASGLLTLSFGKEDPEQFVDGGHFILRYRSSVEATTISGQRVTSIDFDGNYVEFMHRYEGGSLTGRMNIVVSSVDGKSTKVTVNTRYVFTTPRNTWAFSSGGCATETLPHPVRNTPPTRTLCPTYKAEKTILDAIERLGAPHP